MSSLIVEVCPVLKVANHPKADRLDIVQVKGWNVVVRRDLYKPGDLVVYFPPDTILPDNRIAEFGIGNYLKHAVGKDGVKRQCRIGAVRLRQIPSFGHVEPAPAGFEVGADMVDYYGCEKYEPVVRCGDQGPAIPGFYKYKGPETWQNYPDAIAVGTEVIITEKIHGRNCRAALLKMEEGYQFIGGSHNFPYKELDGKERKCIYWAGINPTTRPLLEYLSAGEKNVILYGEVYGQGCQDLNYGEPGHKFRAFDIQIDGEYLSWYDFIEVCQKFKVETVPILYVGPYSPEKVLELTDGPTELNPADKIATKFKGREGVVIKPTTETKQDFRGGLSRVLLKSVSADYHERKGGTEEH